MRIRRWMGSRCRLRRYHRHLALRWRRTGFCSICIRRAGRQGIRGNLPYGYRFGNLLPHNTHPLSVRRHLEHHLLWGRSVGWNDVDRRNESQRRIRNFRQGISKESPLRNSDQGTSYLGTGKNTYYSNQDTLSFNRYLRPTTRKMALFRNLWD